MAQPGTRARWAMTGRAITWTEMPCRRCERVMVPQLVWRNDPASREGHVRHGGGDLCNACYKTVGRQHRPRTARPDRRSLAEQHGLTGERHRAALAVCSMATDAAEATEVLGMLGLLDVDPARVPVTAGEGRWN